MHTDSGTHTQETWMLAQTHTPRHTLRLTHKDPYPNRCMYRNTHTRTNAHSEAKYPDRETHSDTHTRVQKTFTTMLTGFKSGL